MVTMPAQAPDRPSILAVKRGTGGAGAKSLPFDGHIDTVSLAGYVGDGVSGELWDERIYGRSSADMSADMEGGLVAVMVAAIPTSGSNGLRGDVRIAAVADEEAASRGLLDVLRAYPDVHGAIFSKPSNEVNLRSASGI